MAVLTDLVVSFTTQCTMHDDPPGPSSPTPTVPWWYQDTLDTIAKEDPQRTKDWEYELETPIVSSSDLAKVLREHPMRQPWWAKRDGGFCVKDRTLRLGTQTWTSTHEARWYEIQRMGAVQGYYDKAKNVWAFENFDTFLSEMRSAFVYLDHPKTRRWVEASDHWRMLAAQNSAKGYSSQVDAFRHVISNS